MMRFPISCGLSVMCLTLLLFTAQGTKPKKRPFNVDVNCCVRVSKAYIRETVTECYEQLEHKLPDCPIHAYIFLSGKGEYCVDPDAWWLPQRLDRLRTRGIHCTEL